MAWFKLVRFIRLCWVRLELVRFRLVRIGLFGVFWLEATGSAEIVGLACTQADAAGPALGATTALPQVSNSLIPQPDKHLSAAAAVKKVPIRVATAYAEGS